MIDLQVSKTGTGVAGGAGGAAGSIATITLTNPARRNAMTRAMWRDLHDVVQALNHSQTNSCLRNTDNAYKPVSSSSADDLRCIIVRGEAGHFCAGGDISEYPDFRFDEASLRHFHEEEVAPALHALLACDIPVVAQIEGNCMGGGLEIAACCDIRIAGQGATFGAPIAKLGMPMAPQELAIVLRVVGDAVVREMLLEARIFDATQMQLHGFIQRVVADADVADKAQATAQRICALSPLAARLNKQALRAFYLSKKPAAYAEYARAATEIVANPYQYAQHTEHIEGITAFLEKRIPSFEHHGQ